MIDYRKILVEYILHVLESEGTDFLSAHWLGTDCQLPGISEEERQALDVCEEEASARYKPHLQRRDLADLISGITPIETPLMAAVRKGEVQGTTPFSGFKEGQTVTGKGVKPGIVRISKDGTVVIVPKDE